MKTIKRVLAFVLVLAMALSVMVLPASAATFSDVADGGWYTSSVERWTEAGIINGYTDGTFKPNNYISRAEVAKILSTLLGLSEKAENTFVDVSATDWYSTTVLQCVKAGVVNGIGNNKFAPNDNIIREQAFAMFVRALKLTGGDESALTKFVDADEISAWAVPEVATIATYKAVAGFGVNNPTLQPKDYITRAQVAKVLDRLVGVYVDADGDVSTTTVARDSFNGNVMVINANNADELLVEIYKNDSGKYVIEVLDVTDNKTTIHVTENGKKPVIIIGTEVIELAENDPIHIDGTEVVDHEFEVVYDEENEWHHYTECWCGKKTESVACTVKETTESNGDTTKTCSVCGHTETIAAETTEPTTEPTCDHDWVAQDECTNCAVDRTPVEVCSKCGETRELEVVEAHPHHFDRGVCACCGMTEEEALKFNLRVTSDEDYVDMLVTNDYVSKITVTPGDVDASHIEIYAAMRDVASLGVGELRKETKEFDTGLTGDAELKVWLSNVFSFNKGTIYADIEGAENTVIYNLEGSTDLTTGNATITGTPEDINDTRAAWQALTSHISSTTQTNADSYIEIANGSYLVIGDEILCFEKDATGNLVLNNFSELGNLADTIRETVQAYAYESNDSVIAYLAAGTKLAVSNSIATLNDNATITITSDELKDEDVAGILTQIKTSTSGYNTASYLVKLLNTLVGKVSNNGTMYVDINFSEPVEKDRKFYFAVSADNVNGGKTTVDMEVFDDYSLEINVPMDKISAANVGLYVEMKNVASLGAAGTTKKHELNVATGMTATGDLAYWLSNAATFKAATVNVTVEGADTFTYDLVGDLDPDHPTITGTTDTEAARAAWQALASHVTSGANEAGDNSFIKITEASELHIGNEALVFEDDADAMVLDDFNDLSALKQEIKDSVKLVEGDGELKLVIGAGTTLAVSESAAVLNDTAIITICADGLDLDGTLSEIQAAADDNNTLVKTLFTLLNDVIGAANGETVDVTVDFE